MRVRAGKRGLWRLIGVRLQAIKYLRWLRPLYGRLVGESHIGGDVSVCVDERTRAEWPLGAGGRGTGSESVMVRRQRSIC